MDKEDSRIVFSLSRRVVIAGLVLLFVWLLLLLLRHLVPDNILQGMQLNDRMPSDLGPPSVWDWTRSIWYNTPVAQTVSERLGQTFQLLGFGGLMSLAVAAVLLSLGVVITRLTQGPTWLTRLRSVLRVLLVSAGAGMPYIIVTSIFLIFLIMGLNPPVAKAGSAAALFQAATFTSILPTWLLVQAGHGELMNWPEELKSSYGLLARHLAVRMVVRLLELTGAVLAITIFTGGIGSLVIRGALTKDLPLLFYTVWTMAVIVVLARLAASLIEILYDHYGNPVAQDEAEVEPNRPVSLPKGWLYFSLALVVLSALVAWLGPLLAPYGFNQITLADRLAPASAAHLLGADNLGRDILSRLLYGIRTTMNTGLLAVFLMAVLAAGWGLLAAWVRRKKGWMEDLVMLPADVLCAVPWLALPLLLTAALVRELGIMATVLFIALTLLPRAARMLREACRSSSGTGNWLYTWSKAIPVMLLFAVAGGIIYISTISYQGFGVSPPTPEFGALLSGTGRTYILQAPWMVRWPVITLMSLSLVWVMAGDTLLERFGFRSKAVWAKALE